MSASSNGALPGERTHVVFKMMGINTHDIGRFGGKSDSKVKYRFNTFETKRDNEYTYIGM